MVARHPKLSTLEHGTRDQGVRVTQGIVAINMRPGQEVLKNGDTGELQLGQYGINAFAEQLSAKRMRGAMMTQAYQGALHISSGRPRNTIRGGAASRRNLARQKRDQFLQASRRDR